MNWIIKFGEWLESRRVLRKPDMGAIIFLIEKQTEAFKLLSERVDTKASKDSQAVPQIINKEFVLLKARVDRIELLTGLKREPAPTHVEGAARIE